MCVKEFFGYSCGHCSVPTLRPCPLSWSNENYPPCAMPAERPIFTEEFCHPCSRVVWNQKILKDEEEHRNLHRHSKCECEFIFDQEERERRGLQAKGKRKDTDPTPQTSVSGVRVGRYPINYISPHSAHPQNFQQPTPYFDVATLQHTWTPEAQAAAHQYHGYNSSSMSNGSSQQMPRAFHPTSEHISHGQASSRIHPVLAPHPQLLIGTNGAGMRWYNTATAPSPVPSAFLMPPPAHHSHQTNTHLPPLPQPLTSRDAHEHAYTYTTACPGFIWPKAKSEPGCKSSAGCEHHESPETSATEIDNSEGQTIRQSEPPEPSVVTSDNAVEDEKVVSS